MKLIPIFALALAALSCTSNTDKKLDNEDSPVRGTIKIAADESVKRIIDAEIQMYEMSYPAAKLNVIYMPENEAIRKMLNDEVRVAAVTRALTKAEMAALEEKGYPTNPTIIAIDGVAIIANKKSGRKQISTTELKDILDGKKKTQVGFDNSNSSNLNYLIRKLNIADIKKGNVSAAESTQDLIKFIENNPNTIGVIGMSWISDADSKVAADIKSRVQLLAVSNGEGTAYDPTGYWLNQRKYPLERLVYLHIKESHWGLGRGFQKFACSQRGQLIIEKEGIQPFFLFDKEININHEKLAN